MLTDFNKCLQICINAYRFKYMHTELYLCDKHLLAWDSILAKPYLKCPLELEGYLNGLHDFVTVL